jgi:hypothetical protein
MSYKEEVGLFLNATGAPRTTIDCDGLCELVADNITPFQPLSLVTGYHMIITTRVVEDILKDHHAKDKITDLIVDQDGFLLFTRDVNGEDEICIRFISF